MLDHPKFLLFIALVAVVLAIIGGLCDGVLAGPNDSQWHNLQTGSVPTKVYAIISICAWNYGWVNDFPTLEYIVWVPFRLVWIVFTLLIGITVARVIRELLPIP